MIHRSQSVKVTIAFASTSLALEGIIILGSGWSNLDFDSGIRTVMRDSMATGPLLAHFGVVLAMFAAYVRSQKTFGHAPGTLLVLVFMVFLGPVGTVMGFLSAAICYLMPFSFAGRDDDETPAGLFDKRPSRGTVALEPQSLCDVFRYGTLAQRRSAVALIAANYNARFTPALQMALRDEHNAIRVQAGMVVQKLEETFAQTQMDLQANADVAMANHGFGPLDGQLKLARFYDEYAYSGLLDGPRTHEVQANALRAYHQHLKRNPEDVSTIAAIGRLLIRAGQFRVAAEWLQQQVDQDRTTPPIIMWLAEALYRSERYVPLQRLFHKHGELLSTHLAPESAFREVLSLWQPKAPVPTAEMARTAAVPAHGESTGGDDGDPRR